MKSGDGPFMGKSRRAESLIRDPREGVGDLLSRGNDGWADGDEDIRLRWKQE